MPKQTKLPRGISLIGKSYRARLYVDGVQHSLGMFQTIGDARAALDIARAEKARGTFEPPSVRRKRQKAESEARKAQAFGDTRTVRELSEAWLSWLEASGLKIGTVYTYRRHLEAHFLPQFGDRAVSEVTALEISDWLDRMEAGPLSIDGTARIHRDVAAMFKFSTGDAADLPRGFEPWLLTSPVPPLAARKFRRKNRPVERNRDVIAPDDLTRLADLMPPADRLAVLLAGWAGLRLGEVLALRRRHITTDNNGTTWLQVAAQVQARGSGVREEAPKSEAGRRVIPVPSVIVADLEAHLKAHTGPEAEALLFPRAGGGNRLHNPNTVGKRFRAARDGLNAAMVAEGRPPLENFTFHGLRHTALTRLGQQGATLAELKAYAGHSDVKAVEIYQHAERRRLASLTAAMGGRE